jgi:hypothetical protein
MRLTRTALVALLVFATASVLPAQGPGPEAARNIPADCLGFVVVNDLQDLLDKDGKVDRFIQQIGMAPLVGTMMPNGALDAMVGQMGLSEEFTGKGGLAVAMLNPKVEGIDLVGLMQRSMQGSAPPADLKLPFLMILPGTDIEKIFANWQPTQQGQYTQITLPFGPLLGTTVGNYMFFSPSSKALDVVRSSGKSIVKAMQADHLAALGRADIGIHVNMAVAGDLFAEGSKAIENQLRQQKQMMAQYGMAGPQMAIFDLYINMLPEYRKWSEQVLASTVAGRMVHSGLVIEQLQSFKPDSELAKRLAAAPPARANQLAGLPDLPYVMALGGEMMPGLQEGMSLYLDMMDAMLSQSGAGALSAKTRSGFEKLFVRTEKQLKQVGFVIGGAPDGKGLFGLAKVLKVEDSKQMVSDIRAYTDLINHVIHEKLGAMEDDMRQLNLVYVQGDTSVGGTSVDVIDVTHPEMAGMSANEREELRKVLGEERIRFFVSAPDKNTVIATFGGTEAMMKKAVEAKGSNNITDSRYAKEAMKYMPEKPNMLMAIHPANLYDVVISAAKKMDPDAALPPARITCQIPVMVGSAIDGTTVSANLYVPTRLVKDAMVFYMSMQGGGGAAGGDDF